MKITGTCFREFVEFPVLPFDPSVFGFTLDLSDSKAAPACPCFATEDDKYRLWWNWPKPEEREWYGSMSQFFITRRDEQGHHATATRDPIMVFKTERLSELVRHLLVTRYDSNEVLIKMEWSEPLAIQWLRALRSAGIIVRMKQGGNTPEVVSNQKPSKAEQTVIKVQLDCLHQHFGEDLAGVLAQAQRGFLVNN